MTLDLNEGILPYKEFYGQNIAQMPQLIAEGRVPISVAGIMERRLYSGKPDWKDNYFDTGDTFVYHPDRKFKIVLDAQPLRQMTPESKLKNGALVLEDGMYEKLQGHEFKKKELKNLIGRELTALEVKAHPLWKAFARDDALLDEYTYKIFLEMNKFFDSETAMGVYLVSAEKMPTVGAAFIGRLVDRSRLGSRDWLGDACGRFVGVCQEQSS